MTDDFRARAQLLARGNRYEDFEPGRVFEHHLGRTLTEGDNIAFTTLTLHYNPLYFNAAHARGHGHGGLVANPLLVFNIVFGLSVEDLSEGGGPFLGVDQLNYLRPVQVGETLLARSRVLDRRTSDKFKDYGIVTWATEGFTPEGETVVTFQRSNLVRYRQ
ncbi:MaoC family dehydratase [Tistrella bauzanensis]|uniref:MaoC family dehydratase n=1 Tax=Tistrella arctica TaxID=3133430 RepID=A0ABU9YML5_9PROT